MECLLDSCVITIKIYVFGLFFDQKSQMQGVEFLVAIFSQNIPSHDLRTSSMSDWHAWDCLQQNDQQNSQTLNPVTYSL